MEPLLVPIFTADQRKKPDAVTLLGLSETTIKQLIARGELDSVLEGRRRLVVVDSIRDYVNRRRQAAGRFGGEAA